MFVEAPICDLDDVELLQIGLKSRPSAITGPSLQPRPPPPASTTNTSATSGPYPTRGGPAEQPHKQWKPSHGGDDNYDDSEVEVLSISSCDEESSTRGRGPLLPQSGHSMCWWHIREGQLRGIMGISMITSPAAGSRLTERGFA